MKAALKDVVILGAGPAGLGAALTLGPDATLLEGAMEVAGLSRSLVIDGAVFDLGGHSFHTPHPSVRELVFEAVEMESQLRDAWCRVGNDWVAYPFQKHFLALTDARLRGACQAGLLAATGSPATDFDTYLVQKFGAPLADLFMRPYNRKLWGEALSRLTTDWTGERVAGPAGMIEQFAETGGQRTPLQDDTRIAYPARGGFGEIFMALARRVRDLRLGQVAARIDPRRRSVTTMTGETMRWRKLISTLPLPRLLVMLPDVPPAISAAAATLEAIPVNLVMVVLHGRGPLSRQRVYCPDEDVPGHKFVLNHTSSNWLRALPRHGIQVEVAGPPRNPGGLAQQVVASLQRFGLIGDSSEVLRVEVRRQELGYPVPTHGPAAAMRIIRDWLQVQGIYLVGRFAEWAYINADEALYRGLRLGEALARDVQVADVAAE
jgi:UDP-galactopyranose mutase